MAARRIVLAVITSSTDPIRNRQGPAAHRHVGRTLDSHRVMQLVRSRLARTAGVIAAVPADRIVIGTIPEGMMHPIVLIRLHSTDAANRGDASQSQVALQVQLISMGEDRADLRVTRRAMDRALHRAVLRQPGGIALSVQRRSESSLYVHDGGYYTIHRGGVYQVNGVTSAVSPTAS